MSTTKFSDLGLSEPVLRALADCGYSIPTPVQEKSIPIVMRGSDLIASAQTGTGKTAAFMLPVIDDIATRPSFKGDAPLALVLTPTRELALQIEENVQEYGKYVGTRSCVVLGGVSSVPQIESLRRGVDVVIATPGRLIDLVEQGEMILDDVDFFILDEADRMLDLGFMHDVRRISDWVPRPRQTLLFSATISAGVRSLASTLQTDAESVAVAPPAAVADNIDQQVMFVEKKDKADLLIDLLQVDEKERMLVFTGTKISATLVARQLEQAGIRVEAIHSNKSQSQRQRALEAFTQGKARVLVATDIVARGIDVDDITHVINYELPPDAENYVHRIGRTARAGRAGVAVSLCCVEDVSHLRGIENLVKQPLRVIDTHRYHSDTVAGCLVSSTRAAKQRARAGRGRSSGSKWAR
ncbi:MAG: DEAD/DEAH box helicase [Candidatus Krumholzibacteria bacterium]|nr:DEAD/DEAH box helicase [Candidatus Krumholzibacteria bacterium]